MKKIIIILILLSGFYSLSQLSNGLVAQYYFNDGTANDNSSNGLDANYVSATPTNDRFGNPNSAYAFDGSQYIGVPYTTEFDNMDMTVSLWFRSDDTNFGRLIALPYQSAQVFSMNYRSVTSTPNGVNFYADYYIPPNLTPSTAYWAGTSDVLPDGTWHHVVGIRDAGASKMYIYLDCVIQDSVSYSGTTYAAGTPLQIGRFNDTWGQYFTGDIDDIRIYDRVLDMNELDLLCNEGDPSLEINESENSNFEFEIYPNPSNDVLNITLTNGTLPTRIQILSVDGNLVFSGEYSNILDLNSYADGIYFIRLLSDEKNLGEKKFIKN